MYRIFCESYKNFISAYDKKDSQSDYRYKISLPIELLVDLDKLHLEKKQNSLPYKELRDLLYYMNCNIDRFPKFNSFLWILESRGITPEFFGVSEPVKLEEQAKLMNMFLNLAYWN
ncbi:MAG TPA: hypothetical protein VEF53_17900 [Patescibacteria group bacterium]|nr:hypothetical protein [Patescibacteria group bacterium]